MNEAFLRDEVTRLTNEINELTDKYNTATEQIKLKDEEITSLNSKVSDLKQKNYDLFIQIPNITNNEETQKQKSSITTERETSIADVVTKLLGGN